MGRQGFRLPDVDDDTFAVRYGLVDEIVQMGGVRLGIVHVPVQARERTLQAAAETAGRMGTGRAIWDNGK